MAYMLADFLLARIAEDEADARTRGADAMTGHRWKHLPERDYIAIQADWLAQSRRVLAECEAKRRIVGIHQHAVEYAGSPFAIDYCRFCVPPDNDGNDRPSEGDWPCEHLKLLALPYAEHPDYRAEWRP